MPIAKSNTSHAGETRSAPASHVSMSIHFLSKRTLSYGQPCHLYGQDTVVDPRPRARARASRA